MPFTFAHAAAVLPFSRVLARRRLLSAVILGSMVPDFGMFAPWRMGRIETHSAMALLTFCLPVGLASYWIFQYLIKTPVLEVLPQGAYARWRSCASPADIRSPVQWLLSGCAILAGAVTHLVWDGFTHEGARGVRMIPALDEPQIEFGGHHLVGTRLIQDASSLLGLAVVLVFIAYALRPGRGTSMSTRRLAATERRTWMLAYIAMDLALSSMFFLLTRNVAPHGHNLGANVNYMAYASVRGLAAALLVVSLGLRLRLRLRAREVRA